MSQQPQAVDLLRDDRAALLQLLVDLKAHTAPVKAALTHSSSCEEEFKWHENLFAAVIGISSVEAGFMFSVIFNDFPVSADEARPQHFKDQVRLFVALSWGIFVLAIRAGSISAQFFSFNRRYLEDGCTHRLGWRGFRAAGPVLALQVLPLAAFIFSARAIALYLESIGWLAFGLAFLVLLGRLGLWSYEFSGEPMDTDHKMVPR